MNKSTLYNIKIGSTDIFLEDYNDNNSGKITISDAYGYNYSYYWGSMNNNLIDFILSINIGYFMGKLMPYDDKGVFNGKRTAKAIRRTLREELKYELPFYKYMEFQKSLREFIKGIETIDNEYEYFEYCGSYKSSIDFYLIDGYKEQQEMEELMGNWFFNGYEASNYICRGDSHNAIFLKRLYPKLKKELNKIKNERK